jgi:hypothetical protein
MSKLLLTYFSFVLACLVVILAFITAANYIQLAVAILLYPVLVFFAYKVLPINLKHSKKIPTTILTPDQSKERSDIGKSTTVGISDIDKRVFLKLIGSAGVFLFLFSLFNKRAEGLFFKSLPGPVSGSVSLQDIDGNKINPAQTQPMDGYRISEVEDKAISFYGFTNQVGAWIVMRVDIETGSFRYAKGDSDFPKNWGKRENLKYDYYSQVFG